MRYPEKLNKAIDKTIKAFENEVEGELFKWLQGKKIEFSFTAKKKTINTDVVVDGKQKLKFESSLFLG